MIKTARKYLVGFFKFALPLAILGFLLWHIDDEQWEALRSQPKNYSLLAAALMIAGTAVTITFLRWGMLVRSLGIGVGMVEACRLSAIGFLLSFVSAGSVGGDVFKAYFVARHRPGRRFEAVASVLVDRIVGMYGLLLTAVSVLVLMPPKSEDPTLQSIFVAAIVMTALTTIGLLAIILGGKWIDRCLRWIRPQNWFGKLVHRVADPIRLFHERPWHLLFGVGLSLISQFCLALSIFLIARGLYTDSPTLAEHLLMVPVGLQAASLPLTPAGLGVFEATMEWLYRLVPATPTKASGTLVALVFELVKIAVAGVGVIYYWTGGREVQESLQEAEADSLSAN